MNGKQLLKISIASIIFFAFGMWIGGTIVWKNFKADQEWIKEQIVKIQKDERLANAIVVFIEEVEEAGITMDEWFRIWAEQ